MLLVEKILMNINEGISALHNGMRDNILKQGAIY